MSPLQPLRSALLLAIALWCAAAAAVEAAIDADSGRRARGQIEHGGQRWQARDVLLYRDQYLLTLVISDRDFDWDQLLADQRLDAADIDRVQAQGASLLQLGLAMATPSGADPLPSALEWSPAGGTPLFVPGTALDAGFAWDHEAVWRGRLRGTLSLQQADPALVINVQFDALILEGDRAAGELLPADGGAPVAALRALQAAVANPRDRSWPQLLEPGLLQRLRAAWSTSGLDPAGLADEGRELVAPTLLQVHGVADPQVATLEAIDPAGIHWSVRLAAGAEGWRVFDIRQQLALPAAGSLQAQPPPVDPQLGRQGRAWVVLGLVAAVGLFLLALAGALLRGMRRRRAETAHLIRHGIDSRARVVGLVRGNMRVNRRRSYSLLLRWRHPHSGQDFELQSDALWLDRRQHARAEDMIDQVGELPVRLDPNDPLRYHRVLQTERVQQLLDAS